MTEQQMDTAWHAGSWDTKTRVPPDKAQAPPPGLQDTIPPDQQLWEAGTWRSGDSTSWVPPCRTFLAKVGFPSPDGMRTPPQGPWVSMNTDDRSAEAGAPGRRVRVCFPSGPAVLTALQRGPRVTSLNARAPRAPPSPDPSRKTQLH